MSPCASQEQLKRFLRDRLDDLERETIADHLDECTLCQDFLDRITRAPGTHERMPSGPEQAKQDARLLERLKAEGPKWLELAEPNERPINRAGADAAVQIGPSTIGDFPGALPPPNSYPTIDGFRIIREIGRGGMGVVYEAEEERLSRRVALKVLPPSLLTQSKQIQRFEREARAAARLHHTNIVPVFGVGEERGYHYYFMQFIEGKSLATILREQRHASENRLAVSRRRRPSRAADTTIGGYRRVAQIGLQIAEALDHAHRQGILHRDIKPSNLIQDEQGVVWVADFGLAKTPDGDELTSAGELLGTIRYMAPERFRGHCDERSDVYGLGITLYELAARRPAYDAVDRYELLSEIRQRDPVPLRNCARGIPRDLETIIHKAIDRDPARRYSTALELAEDLRCCLDGRPIQARPPSPAERVVRWCKRNRWASAFLLALGLGVIASGWQAIRATSAERAARQAEATIRNERDRAERARDRALGAVSELLLFNNGEEPALMTEEMRASRRALVAAGVRESRELVQELEGYPKAGAQLVSAYHTLSRIELEGGDRQRAIESARAAVAVAEKLFDRERSFVAARALGSALQQLSVALPDDAASEQAAQRSTAMLETTLTRAPLQNVEEAIGRIFANHINMGQRDSDHGRLDKAIDHFQAARKLCESVLEHCGPSPSRLNSLAIVELHACRAYRQSRRYDDSFAAGRRAAALHRDLLAAEPAQPRHRHYLQLSYQELGLGYLDLANSGEAIAWFEKARQTLKSIAPAPGSPVSEAVQAKNILAVVDYNVKIATDVDPARFASRRREVIEESYAICDKLAFVQPLSLELLRIYADGCMNMALYQEQDGGKADVALLRKSEQIWEEVRRVAPGSLEARGFLVIVRRKLADVLEAKGEHEEAARCALCR